MDYRKLWNTLSPKQQNTVKYLSKTYNWKRLFEKFGATMGLNSYDETKGLGHWCLEHIIRGVQEKEELSEESTEETPLPDLQVDNWEHNQTYWYDKDRDIYVVHLPSRKRPLAIPAVKWRSIKEAYSNWDDAPASVNEIARKQGLSRKTIIELLRVMGMTHDSSPWTDEEMQGTDQMVLVEDLLRKKEERILVKAQQREWSRIKKDADKFRRREFLKDDLFNRLMESSKDYQVPKMKLPKAKENYSVVISPTDFHWGKYAPEFGGDAYNRDIAKQRLFDATEQLLGRLVDRGQPDHIVLALGGDGLHIDNQGRTTTRGTLQDCDGTPEELAWTWVELCREYVDFVRQFAPVKLFVVAGNHDYYTSTLLRAAMKGWFNNIPDVDVCESMLNRQYMTYGNSLISFMHGDIGKVKDWAAIIAGEQREAWGRTKHKFIFTGHYHTERELPTFGNVVVYRMPSLAGTDGWHAKMGYKSRKALIGYVVSLDRGVIAQEIEPIDNE